jgi:hypothetical protein
MRRDARIDKQLILSLGGLGGGHQISGVADNRKSVAHLRAQANGLSAYKSLGVTKSAKRSDGNTCYVLHCGLAGSASVSR